MSQTIQMPAQFDQAIREVCGQAVNQAVAALAEKYGFDLEEAQRFLDLPSLKLVRKRGPSPKKETGDKKPKAAAKDGEPKAKRPPTGYLLFAGSQRSVTKEAMLAELEEGEKLKPQAVVTELARQWKALSEEEREAWNEQAKSAPIVVTEVLVE